jgi:hypothetical protein
LQIILRWVQRLADTKLYDWGWIYRLPVYSTVSMTETIKARSSHTFLLANEHLCPNGLLSHDEFIVITEVSLIISGQLAANKEQNSFLGLSPNMTHLLDSLFPATAAGANSFAGGG